MPKHQTTRERVLTKTVRASRGKGCREGGTRAPCLAPPPSERARPNKQTPAQVAPRNSNEFARPLPRPRSAGGGAFLSYYFTTTLGNGYLGSRIDEERSEMRYLV